MDLNKQTVKALLGVACGSIAFCRRAAAFKHGSGRGGLAAWRSGAAAAGLRHCLYPQRSHAGTGTLPASPCEKDGKASPPAGAGAYHRGGGRRTGSGGHGHCSRCGGGGYIHRRAGSSGLCTATGKRRPVSGISACPDGTDRKPVHRLAEPFQKSNRAGSKLGQRGCSFPAADWSAGLSAA